VRNSTDHFKTFRIKSFYINYASVNFVMAPVI